LFVFYYIKDKKKNTIKINGKKDIKVQAKKKKEEKEAKKRKKKDTYIKMALAECRYNISQL
jgi:hypothetical protein